MMRTITVVLLFVLMTVSVFAGYQYGQNVPFTEQWPLYEALRATAAIIFAVVGAWLAIVYPERLRLTLTPQNGSTQTKQQNNIGILLSPAVNSTCVLCIILIVGIAAPLLKRTAIAHEYLLECRGISYSLLVGLTMWQVWTVILTLVPADLILSRANQENAKNEVLAGMRKTSISGKPSTDEG